MNCIRIRAVTKLVPILEPCSTFQARMFYVKPPRGEIHREKLLDLAVKRLRFLKGLPKYRSLSIALRECLTDADSVVTEGTPKDRVSHFALKLAAQASSSRDGGHLLRQVCSLEAIFLRLRLTSMQTSMVLERLREFSRHIKESLERRLDQDLRNIFVALSEACDQEKELSVPFQYVPNLVSNRRTSVNDGLANINPSNFNEFLSDVYEQFLLLQSARSLLSEESAALGRDIAVECSRLLDSPDSSNRAATMLRASDVDAASSHFPLCMKETHRVLQHRHRLPHSSRVGFTLFLKDIGMTSNEAIALWRKQYSLPEAKGSSCGHDWVTHWRKYEYSVRHLYGEEGARKNYSSHSCRSVMGRRSSPSEVLTCPFLEKMINQAVIEEIDHTELACEALSRCKDYFREKGGKEDALVQAFKPSHMYFSVANSKATSIGD